MVIQLDSDNPIRVQSWSDEMSKSYCGAFPFWDFLLFPVTYKKTTFRGYRIFSKIDNTNIYRESLNKFGKDNRVSEPYRITSAKDKELALKSFPKWIPNKKT